MNPVYPNRTGGNTPGLSDGHRRMLYDESGISPEVAAARGYGTLTRREDLPTAFKGYQRRRGLLIPVLSPDGITRSHQLRPDAPRRDKKGKALKYETPGGSEAVLDVHPLRREEVRAGAQDLWITEGIKKADALTSRGLPTVGLIGVWNWQRGGALLPCWDHVRLSGRRAYVVFDSDVMAKEGVQLALERLVSALEGRGADVRVCYLSDGEDGAKVGVDDYLVAGGTVAELRVLARRFEPADLGRVRLSRDEKLGAAIEDLRRTFWAHEWRGQGGHSDRDVFNELVEAAAKGGKLHSDGVRVEISHGTLQIRAKIGSSRTLCKSIARLEEAGLLYRDNTDRKADRSGAFVLKIEACARVKHVDKSTAEEGTGTQGQGGYYPGALHLRAPRLRWSSPATKPRRGTVHGTRKVRQGPPAEPRPAVKRLGKIRGAILDALDDVGGSATVRALCEGLHRARPGDVRRRVLPMLEEAGILSVGDADRHGDRVVTLAADWLGRLEEARDLAGEIESEDLARRRLKAKRAAFHGRHKTRPDRHPANAHADGFTAEIEKLPPPPSPQDLYPLIGHRVETTRGPGELWQVFSGRVGVVLESSVGAVTFMDPAEIRLGRHVA